MLSMHAKRVHYPLRAAVDAAASPAYAQGRALSSCPPPSNRAACDGHHCNQSDRPAPADRKHRRARAARSPRTACTPSASVTPHEPPSMPLHRPRTPLFTHPQYAACEGARGPLNCGAHVFVSRRRNGLGCVLGRFQLVASAVDFTVALADLVAIVLWLSRL